MIQLDLKDLVVQAYAEFYGWTVDTGITADDFTTAKLLERITNDITEKANRDAIQAVVVPVDVTVTDNGKSQQVTLKEARAAAEQAKLDVIQTAQIYTIDEQKAVS